MENWWKGQVNIREEFQTKTLDCQLARTGPWPNPKPFTTVLLKRKRRGRIADREEKGNVQRKSFGRESIEKAQRKQSPKQKVQIYSSTRKPCKMAKYRSHLPDDMSRRGRTGLFSKETVWGGFNLKPTVGLWYDVWVRHGCHIQIDFVVYLSRAWKRESRNRYLQIRAISAGSRRNCLKKEKKDRSGCAFHPGLRRVSPTVF